MLLDMERIIREQERYFLVSDNIRRAFDYVPIGTTMDLHRRYLTDQPLLGLIKKILRGNHHEHRIIGIDQGSAYSPTALNVLLHHVLDIPSSGDAANPPWFRYADNLAYLGHGATEGLTALNQASRLITSHGMALKGEDGPPTDLRLEGRTTLGYVLQWGEGRLNYNLNEQAWQELGTKLSEAHRYGEPRRVANDVTRGWIVYGGPSFEGSEDSNVIDRIRRIAARQGFREITGSQIERHIRTARHHWTAYRDRWASSLGENKGQERVFGGVPHAMDVGGQPVLPEAEVAVPLLGSDLGCPF